MTFEQIKQACVTTRAKNVVDAWCHQHPEGTSQQFAKVTRFDLLKLKNCGVMTAEEIYSVLHKRGKYLSKRSLASLLAENERLRHRCKSMRITIELMKRRRDDASAAHKEQIAAMSKLHRQDLERVSR